MSDFPTCGVDFKIKNESVYDFNDPELNQAQIVALSISKTVYINNRYYDIETFAYNQENSKLEIYLKG